MKVKTRKLVKIVVVAVVVLILLVIGSLVLAYSSNLQDPVTNLFRRIYPGILVGSGSISLADEQVDLAVVRKITPSADPDTALQQIIQNEQSRLLLGQLGVSYTAARVNQELKFYVAGKAEEYQKLLTDYFAGNENSFIKFVIRPSLYDALLRTEYNYDFSANQNAYSKAQIIQAKIQAGTKFEDLAKPYSDDQITGQLGGDLGFVTADEILPELGSVLSTAKVGEVDQNIIVTRHGYEIIYPVETMQKDGQTVTHLKHILVKTTGYENWLAPQLGQFTVRYIKKL